MENTETAEDRLLSTEQAATILSYHVDTLKAWRKRGIGPDFIKLPGKIVYRESVLKSYLDTRTVLTNEATA